MNSVISSMIEKYQPTSKKERENAINEVLQEIVLAGLSRSDFFSKAAFYGGTCLRIFYGLNRFSEDLDFALISKDESFNLNDYFPSIKKELASYGIEMELSSKAKDNTDVQTAFAKGDETSLFMLFFSQNDSLGISKDQKIKIKFEVDMNNPNGGITETKYRFLPAPCEVKVFDESTLFSGKIHAIICRDYKNRVKGRDYYDYLFYCGKGTKINLDYLKNKLINTGKIKADDEFSIDSVKSLLKERFEIVNYVLAKEDVKLFIKEKETLNVWSKDLFLATLDNLNAN